MAIPKKLPSAASGRGKFDEWEKLIHAKQARQDAAAMQAGLPTRGKLLAAKFFIRHRPTRPWNG